MKIGKDRHHRRCKSNGGKNSPTNIAIVDRRKHVAFHMLFANQSAEGIAETLNQVWIDPKYMLIVKERDHEASFGSVARDNHGTR
jgi:hypothetical protein